MGRVESLYYLESREGEEPRLLKTVLFKGKGLPGYEYFKSVSSCLYISGRVKSRRTRARREKKQFQEKKLD